MKSILLLKKFGRLVEMTFGLVNASFSLPEWQAVKMTFFAPCTLLNYIECKLIPFCIIIMIQGWVVQSWVKIKPRISVKFEFRCNSLKGKFICHMHATSWWLNGRENYPRKCFWTKEKEARVKFNHGLWANRPSNNWAWIITLSIFWQRILYPTGKLFVSSIT